ncbi:thiamine phosphate synthase [Microbulbifer sp. SA54]|uniref:thiamine phosphate synthase n=1 Tax=Microbulbifer sp. SA54 TaxID=3401577 RepID=UPI003AAA8F3F
MTTENSSRPIIWIIAGSDSGGGAGIQADLLTAHDLGVHGCCAITANTAQNSLGVPAINAVPDGVLQSQLDALFADLKPAAIKIGLLANSDQVKLVANFLRAMKRNGLHLPVVYDPVAIATSGARLTEDSTGALVLEELLPLCDLITPNTHELAWLAGCAESGLESAADILQAARKVRGEHATALLVTGGHFEIEPGTTADLLCSGAVGSEDWFIGDRIATDNTHGTGCSLSSAVAALLAKGYPLKDACMVANAYVRRGLRLADGEQIGAGAGPVGHCGWPTELQDFPRVLLKASDRAKRYGVFDGTAAKRFAAEFAHPDSRQLGLYPVVDSVEWLEKLAQSGVRTLQLRIKSADGGVREQIRRAIDVGRQYDLRLFINDHWLWAIEYGAYGVHLGQEDLQAADLNAIQQAGLKLGISTHGFYELLYAYEYRPSYLALGAIYATNTKDMSGQLQGLEKLKRMVGLLPDYPLVAIGGIDLERAPGVAATGVGSIAVVSAVTQAADYHRAVAQFRTILKD